MTEASLPGAYHARHMGTIPGMSITECPAYAHQPIENLGIRHLASNHLDPKGSSSPKLGNQSIEAHDRMTGTTLILTEGSLLRGTPCLAHGHDLGCKLYQNPHTCTPTDQKPRDGAPKIGLLGPQRVSITEARQPVTRGARSDSKHDLDFDRWTTAWGRAMPGT